MSKMQKMCSFVKISKNFRFDFANLYQNGKTLATLLFHRHTSDANKSRQKAKYMKVQYIKAR